MEWRAGTCACPAAAPSWLAAWTRCVTQEQLARFQEMEQLEREAREEQHRQELALQRAEEAEREAQAEQEAEEERRSRARLMGIISQGISNIGGAFVNGMDQNRTAAAVGQYAASGQTGRITQALEQSRQRAAETHQRLAALRAQIASQTGAPTLNVDTVVAPSRQAAAAAPTAPTPAPPTVAVAPSPTSAGRVAVV